MLWFANDLSIKHQEDTFVRAGEISLVQSTRLDLIIASNKVFLDLIKQEKSIVMGKECECRSCCSCVQVRTTHTF